MKFFGFVIFIVLLLHFTNSSDTIDELKNLVGKLSPEDRLATIPCLCEKNNYDVLKKQSTGTPKKEHYHNPLPTGKSSQPKPLSEMDAEERRERLNESMARLMQLMTFLGHIDNFLTQKTSGLLKIMGKAVDPYDDEENHVPRYRSFRQPMPKMTTTISS